MADLVAIDGPAGPSMAAMDGPAGPSMAAMDGLLCCKLYPINFALQAYEIR